MTVQGTEKLVKRMLVENLSKNTISTYVHFTKRLIDYHGILPREISTEQIYEFLSKLRVKQKLSNSTIKQAVGCIKYLYRHNSHDSLRFEIQDSLIKGTRTGARGC